jgi:dethiobiotin synthetase
MKPAYFITGTDTGVGKTWVSCALLRHLATRYPRVVGMKPVAAGTIATPHGDANEDCLALRAASTLRVPAALDNPYCYAPAIAPHLAAKAQGQSIDIGHIVHCFEQLRLQADAIVVEGAGGFWVPLSETHTSGDLARALNLPVLMVVGLRLGCLNHALLTAHAIRSSGLHLAGWIANRIDPAMSHQDDNIAALRQRLSAPLWADVKWGQGAVSFRACSRSS